MFMICSTCDKMIGFSIKASSRMASSSSSTSSRWNDDCKDCSRWVPVPSGTATGVDEDDDQVDECDNAVEDGVPDDVNDVGVDVDVDVEVEVEVEVEVVKNCLRSPYTAGFNNCTPVCRALSAL